MRLHRARRTPAGRYSVAARTHVRPRPRASRLRDGRLRVDRPPSRGRCVTVPAATRRSSSRAAPACSRRVSDFCYVPRDADGHDHERARRSLRAHGRSGERSAARALRQPPRTCPVELRGAGSVPVASATTSPRPAPSRPTGSIAVEVLTPGGNWSSYPPHKHDEERPGEAVLEEIYYFEVRGGRRSARPDPAATSASTAPTPPVRSTCSKRCRRGDAILIPHGYHGPTMAAPATTSTS